MKARTRSVSSESLDGVFVAHYARMLAWLASSWALIHRRPRTSSTRNVRLSQVRRAATHRPDDLSLMDYESAEIYLRSVPQEEVRQAAYAALQRIAEYACQRKATSKAASALILRFFHRYYPREIACILQTTEPAVAAQLKVARAEAHAYLEDPDRLHFLGSAAGSPVFAPAAGNTKTDFLAALRHAIYAARTGTCLTPTDLERLYASRRTDPLDAVRLAHLVSCVACLDTVNRRLGLRLLSGRDPSDMLGRGGRSGGDGSGGTGGSGDPALVRARLKDVREDRPQELRIVVNGLLVGSQAVSGPVSEQRLKILVTEQIGFIEIFNEHDTCLLYLDVEPPPIGVPEQSVRVDLSEGRYLAATLAFHDLSPTLHVLYQDVSLGTVPVIAPAPVAVGGEEPPRRSWWARWPLPLRFALGGLVLGLLVANPARTFAAGERLVRAIVHAIVDLAGTLRPRSPLSSRTIPRTVVTLVGREPHPLSREAQALVAAPKVPSDLELLEVALDALRRLDAVSALTVEHVSVEPGLDRRLHVQGVVDTDARRHNIRDALTGLPSRLVSVELITLAEEAQRPARSHAQSPTIVHATELTRDRVPAFDDVRRYVTQRARTASDPTAVSEADESIDDAVRRFSTAMLSRSLQARLHARAVLDLVNRVPSSEVERLSARARSSWRELIQRHADSCRHETATLREDLERVFSPDPAPEQGS